MLLAAVVHAASPGVAGSRRAEFTWVRTFSAGNNDFMGGERALALAFDAAGNVLAAGRTETPKGSFDSTSFSVAKWSTKGVLQWTRILSDASMGRSEALTVTAALDGSVVAGGHLTDAGGNQRFAVAKWNSDGVEQWVKRFDRSNTSPEQARIVAVDPAGDVLAVGTSFSDDTAWDVAIFKLRGQDGEVLWSRHIDGVERSFDTPFALALGADGDLFIGGEIGNETESYCAVMKVRGSDGERLWTNSLDRPNGFGGGEQVNALALTSTGDVVACGTAYGGETADDMVVGRFDNESGGREWQYFAHSNLGVGDEGMSVAVDGQDNVLAAGNSPDISQNHALLVKLEGSSGLGQWRRRVPMPTVDPDFSSNAALKVAVDDRSHAFLLCQRFGDTDSFDGLVAEWNSAGDFKKLRQLPEVRPSSDELPVAIAIDRRGNLAIAGESNDDFAVAFLASGRVERVAVRPGRLTFGRVEVGEERGRSFLVRNIGTAPLSGEITASASQFRLMGPGGPADSLAVRVPARGSLRVFVRFNPSESGRKSGFLTLNSTDPRRPAVRIPVSGVGKAID